MATSLTTITNISKQNIPILVDSISNSAASTGSDIPASRAEQMQIAPGAEFSIESRRLDKGQLEQLRRLGLITYVVR